MRVNAVETNSTMTGQYRQVNKYQLEMHTLFYSP